MKHVCDSSKSTIVHGQVVIGCRICLPTTTHQAALYAAKYNRVRSIENHRADLVQRYDGDKPNPEFAKLYEKTAREQWGDEAVETMLRGNTNGRD